MAFNIREFAKNALLTAQKHIDNALDIHNDEEEADGEEEVLDVSENENVESDEDISMKISDGQSHWEAQNKAEKAAIKRHESALNEGNRNEQPSKDLSRSEMTTLDTMITTRLTPSPGVRVDDGFREIELFSTGNESFAQKSLGPVVRDCWHMNEDDEGRQNEIIVDTEPNPIRDGHESGDVENHVYHHYHTYSSSHSPDDEEEAGSHGDEGGETTAGRRRHSSGANSSNIFDLSVIESSGIECGQSEPTHKTDDREMPLADLDNIDIRTIASSDIEVIKHSMDDWSVASNGTTATNRHQAKQTNQAMAEAMRNSTLFQQTSQEKGDEKAVFEAKIRHQGQKIEELGRVIENLKQANASLHSKNKQIAKASASTEADLKKKFDEKVFELDDLMTEGKKLSEHSGRQAKEIRRLREQVSQLDMVSAARDSAMEELRAAHSQIAEHSKNVAQIKDECEKLGKERNKLLNDLQTVKATNESTNQHAVDAITELQQMKNEMQRLEKALKAANRAKEEFERENRSLSARLLNKTAHETIVEDRERGLVEDLRAERYKNDSLMGRIRELEQRLEDMQNKQREFAVEIQNSNSPLLINIASLEEKMISLERQNESLGRQLRAANDALLQQKRRQDETSLLLQNSLEQERHRLNAKTEQLSKCQSECSALISKTKNLETELDARDKTHQNKFKRLDKQNVFLSEELATKQKELGRLLVENRDLQRKLTEALVVKPSPPALVLSAATAAERQDSDAPSSIRSFRAEIEQLRRMQQSSFEQRHSSSPSPLEMGVAQDHAIAIGTTKHLHVELEGAQAQLFQLRKRFDNLLEMYGGCLETIEELRMDNEDLKQICKEQALQISELKCSPNSATMTNDDIDNAAA